MKSRAPKSMWHCGLDWCWRDCGFWFLDVAVDGDGDCGMMYIGGKSEDV